MMIRTPRAVAVLAILLCSTAVGRADEPKVELRWAETKAVAGRTDAKPVTLSCTDGPVYLRSAPAVTGREIAAARVRAIPANGGQALVELTLTPKGAEALAAEEAGKPLVALVDGRVVAAVVLKSKPGATIPFGPFTKTAEAEEVAAKLGKP